MHFMLKDKCFSPKIGKKRGYPLLLLFNTVMDQLASAVKQEKDPKGKQFSNIENQEIKLSLFGDY